MKPIPGASTVQKKGHVCPPSDAVHPRDRWETAFVYAFITKFTNTKAKTEGFETPEELVSAQNQVDVDCSIAKIGCP